MTDQNLRRLQRTFDESGLEEDGRRLLTALERGGLKWETDTLLLRAALDKDDLLTRALLGQLGGWALVNVRNIRPDSTRPDRPLLRADLEFLTLRGATAPLVLPITNSFGPARSALEFFCALLDYEPGQVPPVEALETVLGSDGPWRILSKVSERQTRSGHSFKVFRFLSPAVYLSTADPLTDRDLRDMDEVYEAQEFLRLSWGLQ